MPGDVRPQPLSCFTRTAEMERQLQNEMDTGLILGVCRDCMQKPKQIECNLGKKAVLES